MRFILQESSIAVLASKELVTKCSVSHIEIADIELSETVECLNFKSSKTNHKERGKESHGVHEGFLEDIQLGRYRPVFERDRKSLFFFFVVLVQSTLTPSPTSLSPLIQTSNLCCSPGRIDRRETVEMIWLDASIRELFLCVEELLDLMAGTSLDETWTVEEASNVLEEVMEIRADQSWPCFPAMVIEDEMPKCLRVASCSARGRQGHAGRGR